MEDETLSQSHRLYTVLQLRNGCHIHFSQQRKPSHGIQTHSHAGRETRWESKCVCVAKTLLLFRDYTFNLGMRKWLRANNWAPWCLQRQNINSLCSATHWVKGLIDTKTVLDMKWAKWRQYCCALVVVLVCNTRKDFPWIIYLSLYYNFHHDWDFRTAVETHLISLSSRSASFFCFLISSRLRRASARSLTARSRSRRRLSHRVLGKERRREVYQPVIIGRSTLLFIVWCALQLCQESL